MKKTIIIFFIFSLLTALPIIWFNSKNIAEKGEIEIFEGASMKQVAELLEAENIIENADVFYYFVRLKTIYLEKTNKIDENWKPNVITPGRFIIYKGDFSSIVHQLSTGEGFQDDTVKVTIPEGKQIKDMAIIFEKSELFSSSEFLEAVNDKEIYLEYQKLYSWLPESKKEVKYLFEGYLHANTYIFDKDATAKDAIGFMLKETDKLYHLYKEDIKKSALAKKNEEPDKTFSSILTLASVVEGESMHEEDRAKVAQVFINRINIGMKLESDMTAAYANGEHKVFMYNKDIKINSLFNTYVVNGLPIGPINSPSKSSILGVLKPEGKQFDMLFFYARPSGETFYAKTWKQHERNRINFEHEWKELENK